jgi:hypothetical protein
MKTICSLVLILTLAVSTYAGEMGNGSPQPPVPAQTNSEPAPSANDISTDGEMGNGAAETTTAAEAVLDVIQSLLALI